MKRRPFLLVIGEVPVGIKEYLLRPVESEKLSNKIKQLVFGGVARNAHQRPLLKLFSYFSFYNPASFLMALALSVFSHVKESSFLPKCP